MSSYINMDHAGWVQRNITASQSRPMKARDRRAKANSKGWYAAPAQLNEFHKRAFDILGIVGGGIYNAPIIWNAVYWQSRQLSVPWRFNNVFGTWDFSGLTRFVFLCHEARIRGYLDAGGGPGFLRVWLSERSHEGEVHQRHPNLYEALAAWRNEFRSDHSIVYPQDRNAFAEEPYLIWSNYHRAWWRPKSCGYTLRIEDAGRYPRTEAIKIASTCRDRWSNLNAPTEIAIPERDVLEHYANAAAKQEQDAA